MKCPSTVAALALPFLLVPAAAQVAQQRGDLIEALRGVQRALHSAERAEVDLLAAARLRGGLAEELGQLGDAIARLRGARDGLRSRLAGAGRPSPEVAEKAPAPEPRLRPKRDVEAAVARALEWLDVHQDEDGKWDADGFMKHDREQAACDGAGNPVHDVGVTGLAILAFLGDGNTLRSGRYKENLKKAVAWLRNQQGPSGLIGTNASHDFVYDHAIATYAMCEAFGLSQYKLLRNTAQQAIAYLESHRNPFSVWRYQPRDNDNDASVTSWCLLAYRSAMDHGLDVNANAMKMAQAFFDQVTDPKSGKSGYTKRGELSSRHPGDHGKRFPVERGASMTAVGLASRFLLGQDPAQVDVMQKAARWILSKAPDGTDKGAVDHHYWFQGSRALWGMGPGTFDRWTSALVPIVLDAQRQDGNAKGSWDPVGVWGEDGGRVYSTALLALSMQIVARHSRLMRER